MSTCTWSDAALFTDPVVVVGDGDFAYESALFAAEFSRDVVVMSVDGPRVKVKAEAAGKPCPDCGKVHGDDERQDADAPVDATSAEAIDEPEPRPA